jgi:hypothetical protein
LARLDRSRIQLPDEEKGEPTADESRQCAVCLHNRACTTILWCGHANLCVSCARNIVLQGNCMCPTCAKPITRIVRTY